MTKETYIEAAISAIDLLSKENPNNSTYFNALITTARYALNKIKDCEDKYISFDAQGLCDIITSLDTSIPEEIAITIAENIINGTFKREKILEIGRYINVFDEFKDWAGVCNFNTELVAFGLSKGINIDLDSPWSELEYEDMVEFIRSVEEKTTESEFYGVMPTTETTDRIYIWTISKDLLND